MSKRKGLRDAAQAAIVVVLGGSALFGVVLALHAGRVLDFSSAGVLLGCVAMSLAAVCLLQFRAIDAQAVRTAAKADSLSQRLLPVLDTLSQRLLRVEARLSQIATSKDAPPSRESAVADVSTEVSLLGELVRDLAVALAEQDRDVAALKDQIARTGSFTAVPPSREPQSVPQASVPAPARPITPTLFPPRAPEIPAQRRHDGASDEAQKSAAIMEAFEEERLELHLQPIVSLPQRKVQFYEALARLRLRDETLLVPAEFLPVLERHNVMPRLDRKVIALAAAIGRHLASRGSDASISCNLSAAALAEPGFLRGIAAVVEAHPDLLGRLVLEVSQRSWRGLDAETAGALGQLKDRGIQFALDRATDLRMDPLSLADRGVRFVKLPSEMLLSPRGLDIEIGDLATVLSRAGIRLIAERVEREEDVPNLIDLDVTLAQGFVFAPPRPVRNEVLTGAIAHAPAAAAAIQRPDENPEPPAASPATDRLPFRSFLRRAG